MNYPKRFMRLSELTKKDDADPSKNIGLPEKWLRTIYYSRSINKDHSIAWKMDASKKNSPIIFDTDELEKYRKSQCTGR